MHNVHTVCAIYLLKNKKEGNKCGAFTFRDSQFTLFGLADPQYKAITIFQNSVTLQDDVGIQGVFIITHIQQKHLDIFTPQTKT